MIKHTLHFASVNKQVNAMLIISTALDLNPQSFCKEIEPILHFETEQELSPTQQQTVLLKTEPERHAFNIAE